MQPTTQAERVERDTKLSPGQQEARALNARVWAARILFLQQISGCDIRLALKAIEDTDQQGRNTQ